MSNVKCLSLRGVHNVNDVATSSNFYLAIYNTIKMKKIRTSLFILRHRWWVLLLTAIILLAAIIPISKIRINPDLESYMPDTMTSKINNKRISEVFGNDETMLLVFESEDVLQPATLKRIQDISEAFMMNGAFEQVLSLFQTKNIQSNDGMMVVTPVVEIIPEEPAAREVLRESIRGNELAYGLVVSEDFRYAMIMLTTERQVQDAVLMEQISQVLAQYPGKEKVYITGLPYLRNEANDKIGLDLMVLLPIGLLVMLVFLWVSFREFKAMILPFSVVVFSIVLSMGLIPALGWELSLIGVLIPIMMIAIANNYGVHFVAKYQEVRALHPRRNSYKLLQEVISYLKKPVILCGLTTIVGTLGLVVHLLIPARQMGVIASIAIAFALLLSLTYIPALLSMFKKTSLKPEHSHVHKGVFHFILTRTGELVKSHPKRMLAFFTLFFVLVTVGVFRIHIAPDTNKVLPDNHGFNRAVQIADAHFGGSKMINILFDGDATDPALLKRIDGYSHQLEQNPLVGRTASLSMMIKKISMALHEPGEPGYNEIPDDSFAVSQYLELYGMSADIADFERFISFNYTHTLMTIQYSASSLQEVEGLLQEISEIMQEEPLPYVVGGSSLIDKEISQSVKTGQYYSLLFAFVAILLLLSIIFRSFTAGLIGSLPLVFAVFCTFGLMGWIGIELNIVTALLSSISIGLGVDFTIHVFWRLKSELQQSNDLQEAIDNTIRSIGRGITINAFSVMLGFSVLFLSAFPLIQSFAFLIIISLLLCLISALALVPALCLILKPKFLIVTSHRSPDTSLQSEVR